MDELRAYEIMQSPDVVSVRWQGEPVWIDSVNMQDKTAVVHPVGDPNRLQTVPVHALEESQEA